MNCALPGCGKKTQMRCSGCKQVGYCNIDHQRQHWQTHKPACQLISANGASKSGSSKPRIIMVDIDGMTSDFDFYDPFRSALYSCAEVQVCKTVQALVAALIGPSSVAPPAAVLLTEPTLVERKRRRSPVHAALSDYVHKKGGRVVFACSFSSFVTPPDLDSYFKDIWALPWRFGSYQRTVHHLQPNHPIVSKTTFPKLPNNYSMKTVDLKGVKPEDCVYMPSADSRVQSMVFAPRLVEQGQPGAAMTLVGSGWVGWVGDVNAEEGSTEVLLAMMGLKH